MGPVPASAGIAKTLSYGVVLFFKASLDEVNGFCLKAGVDYIGINLISPLSFLMRPWAPLRTPLNDAPDSPLLKAVLP